MTTNVFEHKIGFINIIY